MVVGAIQAQPWWKVYAITDEGHRALRTWLLGPVSQPHSVDDDFYMRLLFVRGFGEPCLREMLARRVAHARNHLAALRDEGLGAVLSRGELTWTLDAGN